jgi:peroxiredoxin Q/BCP
VVVGVSGDDVASHDAWVEKLGIPFTLVADPSHVALEAYGVWGEREYNGNKYMGTLRTTFLIAPNGSIERVWEKVVPSGHAAEVLEALRTAAV